MKVSRAPEDRRGPGKALTEAVGLYWFVYWESALLTEQIVQWRHRVVDSSCRSVGGAAVPGARHANMMRQIFPLPPPGASYTKLADNCRNCYPGEVRSVPREYTEDWTEWRMWAGRKAPRVIFQLTQKLP